ncbi:sensor histidine kinase [Metabacillus fastidiosus]|uniref:sensor histidine kinase n=1 Tax=Metabacillus fastidiosus TaxID=1458 RepID=UPI003D28885C
MRLRDKINLYTSVLFIILLIIMNVAIYSVFSHLMVENELDRAKAESEKTARDIRETIEQISPGELLRAYVPVDGMIGIVTEAGRQVTTSPSERSLQKRESTFYPGEKHELITYKKKDYVFISSPIILKDGTVANLQMIKSIESTRDMLGVLKIVFIVVTVIAMIPVLISSRLLSNLITRPIWLMTDTMREIQKSGQFKRLTLEEKSKDELVEMGKTFNHMIDLLQTNFKKQEQFVSNASHELKTPLTIIESYADLLKRRGLEREDLFHESVEAIHSEAIRMREMTEQLLQLAKHDENWNIDIEKINLTQFIAELAPIFQNAYRREMKLKSTETIKCYTDAQKLKQLIYIFLDNARKYSDEAITVSVGKIENRAYVQIDDRGIGIPKEDLPKIFDRFYRVDKARSRKHGGSGLGLSMAKEIADAINVRIKIDSLEGKGTTVILFLPLSSSSHFSKL